MKQYSRFYEKAFKILGDLTPLESDCGALCNAACCKGNDKTGMRLFPHEETAFTVHTSGDVRLCVCNGSCNRNQRPLACRIFPLFPVLHSDGHISAEIDTRSLRLCPLSENCDRVRFNKDFARAVRRVGRLLCKDPECREFIKDASAEITQYSLLLGFDKRLSRRR